MMQFLAGLFLGLVGVRVLVALSLDWDTIKHTEALDAAQNMDIGEGVTLSRGLKALFGGETRWMVVGKESVQAMAGMNRPAASLYVYPKTGEIQILLADSENEWEDERGREAVIALMVKAAKDRERSTDHK